MKDDFYSNLIHDSLKLFTMNLRANMVDEFPVTLSCLKDQTWSEGTKMMKLMRSSEVSNLFCNLTKSRKVVCTSKVRWY